MKVTQNLLNVIEEIQTELTRAATCTKNAPEDYRTNGDA